MKTVMIAIAIVAATLASGLALAPNAQAGTEKGLPTTFSLLIGHPLTAAPSGPSVTILPGTLYDRSAAQDDRAKAQLNRIAELSRSFRLKDLRSLNPTTAELALNRSEKLPTWVPSLSIEVTLLAFSDETATYRVTLRDRDKLLSAPELMIRRGQDGVIGGRDGDEAPYFFLFIEPSDKGREVEPTPNIKLPTLIHKVQPEYPPDARAARVQGTVILKVAIDAAGNVTDVSALRPLPLGLTESAIAAVSQWRYEPAHDAAGKAIPIYLSVTVNFRLNEEEPEKK